MVCALLRTWSQVPALRTEDNLLQVQLGPLQRGWRQGVQYGDRQLSLDTLSSDLCAHVVQ